MEASQEQLTVVSQQFTEKSKAGDAPMEIGRPVCSGGLMVFIKIIRQSR